MVEGKNAVVTGSTSGIGLAIANTLVGKGCNVMLNGFGDQVLIEREIAEFRNKYPSVSVAYSPADMSKADDIAALVAEAEKAFGSVDILVNNAGIQFTAPIEDFPIDKWNSIIAVNLSAAFHSIRAALPGMKKRNYGRIINIASVHGLVASAQKCAYVAAKHALVGLTKVVALETAEHNITCNAICPGWVHTQLVQNQIEARAVSEGIDEKKAAEELVGEKQPSKRFVQPEYIGDLVLFLCSEAGSAVTGAPINIDGGWLAQ
jgi:3-hydroxybutyrate dehydrogenase